MTQTHYHELPDEQDASDRFRDSLAARELHSSRAAASIVAAVLVAGACLFVLLEALLKAIGQRAWLVDPRDAAAWVHQLPGSVPPLILGTAGLLILLAGLLFLLKALLPGRLHRHAIPARRGIVVVDDEVIASSLARRARTAANVSREQVLVAVSRNLVEVQLRPTSGTPVDEALIQGVVEDELLRTRIEPMPQVRVQVSSSGVVGQ
ncbi:hypothetical protein D477_013345 [Arthrobacter crystallopoietes BAB-32]|uniref:DNA/RNA endonuclease G, NUC1 n=1 Tax=Arthrobacter crystallopoietes BAB-32 TaxID=1246476 RepID=N1V124_9MICC|nr:hypothetical protein [Arthrobacter crystallopoietes]EMY33714.1 hypothetical protein D477_013345 [Arthrobacter crystallopoietes BAB-32]